MVGRNLTFGLTLEGMNSRPIDEVNKKMDKMKESGKGAGSGVKAMMDNMDKAGKKMQKAGKGLMKGVTAPIVGIGTAAVATVTSFDDAMANVQKLSGATGESFDELREKAKELGSTTAFSAKNNWSVVEKFAA